MVIQFFLSFNGRKFGVKSEKTKFLNSCIEIVSTKYMLNKNAINFFFGGYLLDVNKTFEDNGIEESTEVQVIVGKLPLGKNPEREIPTNENDCLELLKRVIDEQDQLKVDMQRLIQLNAKYKMEESNFKTVKQRLMSELENTCPLMKKMVAIDYKSKDRRTRGEFKGKTEFKHLIEQYNKIGFDQEKRINFIESSMLCVHNYNSQKYAFLAFRKIRKNYGDDDPEIPPTSKVYKLFVVDLRIVEMYKMITVICYSSGLIYFLEYVCEEKLYVLRICRLKVLKALRLITGNDIEKCFPVRASDTLKASKIVKEKVLKVIFFTSATGGNRSLVLPKAKGKQFLYEWSFDTPFPSFFIDINTSDISKNEIDRLLRIPDLPCDHENSPSRIGLEILEEKGIINEKAKDVLDSNGKILPTNNPKNGEVNPFKIDLDTINKKFVEIISMLVGSQFIKDHKVTLRSARNFYFIIMSKNGVDFSKARTYANQTANSEATVGYMDESAVCMNGLSGICGNDIEDVKCKPIKDFYNYKLDNLIEKFKESIEIPIIKTIPKLRGLYEKYELIEKNRMKKVDDGQIIVVKKNPVKKKVKNIEITKNLLTIIQNDLNKHKPNDKGKHRVQNWVSTFIANNNLSGQLAMFSKVYLTPDEDLDKKERVSFLLNQPNSYQLQKLFLNDLFITHKNDYDWSVFIGTREKFLKWIKLGNSINYKCNKTAAANSIFYDLYDTNCLMIIDDQISMIMERNALFFKVFAKFKGVVEKKILWFMSMNEDNDGEGAVCEIWKNNLNLPYLDMRGVIRGKLFRRNFHLVESTRRNLWKYPAVKNPDDDVKMGGEDQNEVEEIIMKKSKIEIHHEELLENIKEIQFIHVQTSKKRLEMYYSIDLCELNNPKEMNKLKNVWGIPFIKKLLLKVVYPSNFGNSVVDYYYFSDEFSQVSHHNAKVITGFNENNIWHDKSHEIKNRFGAFVRGYMQTFKIELKKQLSVIVDCLSYFEENSKGKLLELLSFLPKLKALKLINIVNQRIMKIAANKENRKRERSDSVTTHQKHSIRRKSEDESPSNRSIRERIRTKNESDKNYFESDVEDEDEDEDEDIEAVQFDENEDEDYEAIQFHQFIEKKKKKKKKRIKKKRKKRTKKRYTD